MKIKWRSPRRDCGKLENAEKSETEGPKTEADLQRQRKLLRSLQLEASSLRFQITLPGGAQANLLINGAKLYVVLERGVREFLILEYGILNSRFALEHRYSTNARWQRIFSLKHMFNVKHYKLIHIESMELRFGWDRDHADRESGVLHNMGMHHKCPIEIRMTTEYEFSNDKRRNGHIKFRNLTH